MGRRYRRWMRSLSVVVLVLSLEVAGQAGAAVVTGGGDDLRTGWYPESSSITPQLVSGGSFGQMWSANVEGSVYAQPLLANGTLLVATENNKVYGLDPVSGALKWSKPLDVGTPWNPADIGCADLTPSIGVTSTPVIDTATNIAYMTHKTYASGTSGPARWLMDAVNIASGKEEPGFPVELAGAAQNAPSRTFSPTTQLQRPALLLLEGVVYAAFGSHCDTLPWQGWIFGVSEAGKVTARYVDNTTAEGAGIWQSGAGLMSDGPGTIMFATGNGGAPSEPAAGANPPANLGEAVVRLRVQSDGSLKPVDFFAPFNGPTLDEYDADFASGGVTGLPSEFFGTASFPHLAVADGKQGYVYLLNRDSLGGVSQGPGGSDNVIQRIGPRGGVWSRPGVWPGEGGYVYIPTSSGSSAGGNLDVYKYGVSGSGTPSLSLAGSSEEPFGWGSGAPVITSDGTTPGSALVWVVWEANRSGAEAQLRAYDPVPVGGHPVLRYESPIGTGSNYSTPGVGAGRLYVGNREGKVIAFGSPIKAPLSGSALSFPATTDGQTREATLTLTANEELTLSSVSSSSAQFKLGTPTPALPATLAAGHTVTVRVTFAPTEKGLVSGTLTATTSTGKEVQFALSGTGQAVNAELIVSPPVLSFQGTAIGGERAETATFRNGGAEPLQIEKVKLPGAPFGTEGAPKAGDTIAPGGAITVTITFHPTSGGVFEGSLELQTNGGDGKVALSGSAGAPGMLQIDGETTEFGPVAVGGAATRSFTITNVGGTAVSITKSKPPIGGEFTADTLLQEGATVQAGETVTEQVTFAPTAPGEAHGEWAINGEDTTGLHRVQFVGTGVSVASGEPEPTPTHTPTPGQTLGGLGGVSQQSVLASLGVAPAHGAAVTLATTRLSESRHGTIAVKVACAAWAQSCTGDVALHATARIARARRRAARVTMTLATGSFALHGGQASVLTLRLTADARALLSRTRVLASYASIAARDPAGLRQATRADVTIRAAPAARGSARR
jgi:hypothetical protein